MKSKKIIMMFLAAHFGLVENLLAATGPREDSSSFLVWAFLGMCALIVIVQLMPAMILTFGMLKSLYNGDKKPVEIPLNSDK